MLRIPHCLDKRLIDDSKVASLTHPPHFTHQKHYYFYVSGTHFCWRLSKPQRLVRPEGLCKFKNSPYRVSNPRPSSLKHSALTTTLPCAPFEILVFYRNKKKMNNLPEFCGCFWGYENSNPLPRPSNPRGLVTCKRCFNRFAFQFPVNAKVS
jgi:hypothetical protein